MFEKIAFSLLFSGIIASAANADWVKNVNVTKIGTYQYSESHFVWLSKHPVSECQSTGTRNPVLHFSEANPGGKSLLAMLMAAIVSKSSVDVQVKGCDIIEVYLK